VEGAVVGIVCCETPPTSPLFTAPLGGFIILKVTRSHLKSTQLLPFEMIAQDKTHFRFRFSLVLFLVFLLTSPTQASSGVESCAAVVLAWTGAEVKDSVGKDAQFVRNLVDCLNGAKKAYSEIQGIIKQLPELIDKVLPVARREGLVLLSVYVLYKSYELYDEAMTLEANEREYRDQLDALKKEWKPLRDLIDTELIPHVEKVNVADFEKITYEVLQRMGRLLTAIQELSQAIRQGIKTGGSNQRRSIFFAVCGGVLCLYFMVSPIPSVSIPVCVATLGTAGYSWLSYNSLSETLPKLESLGNHATKMKEEITSYQITIDFIPMRAKLRGEL